MVPSGMVQLPIGHVLNHTLYVGMQWLPYENFKISKERVRSFYHQQIFIHECFQKYKGP